MPPDTDLLAFTNLYKRFGIECRISDCDEGFKVVLLTSGSYPVAIYTMDERIHGFKGCTSGIVFDKEGNFLKQGIW
jgi:hypothetical protein